VTAGAATWAAFLGSNEIAALSRDGLLVLSGAVVLWSIPLYVILCTARWLLGNLAVSGDRDARLSACVLVLLGLGLLYILITESASTPRYLLRQLPLLAVAIPLSWPRFRRWRWIAIPALVALATQGVAGGVRLLPRTPRSAVVLPVAPGHPGRIVLLGVDGMCWETLQRWARTGGSGDYRWMRDHAYIGPLETLTPTVSPRIWSSMATGVVPEQHGVLGFTSWDVRLLAHTIPRMPRFAGGFLWLRAARALELARSRPASSQEMRRPPFWEAIVDVRRPVDVVGWWATWPAAPLHGRLVSDRFFFEREARLGNIGPLRRLTFPPRLEEELRPLRVSAAEITSGDLEPYVSDPTEILVGGASFEHHDILSELPMALAMDETYERVAVALLESSPPEGIAAFYFRGLDLVSHSAMQFSDLYPESSAAEAARERFGGTLGAYYARTFARLRRFVDLAGESAAVIVVSDHGFEPIAGGRFGHEGAPPGVVMILGAAGHRPRVAPGVLDVAPTLLWLTGYPLAEDMPGRPWTELFPGASGTAPTTIPSYGDRARNTVVRGARMRSDEEMLDLLRTLGYLD
jgi:predicted AlkP superfamily pyrophosphatase or phosphodiesterase